VGEESLLGRLLIVEAIGIGPYQRAIEKRGPGLHHLALNVSDLEEFILSLSGSGWLLHPHSIASMKYKTAWLTRPGMPLLIEVHQIKPQETPSFFVEEISFPEIFHGGSLLQNLACPQLSLKKVTELNLRINQKQYSLSNFFPFLK
jgi:hypothetical protein